MSLYETKSGNGSGLITGMQCKMPIIDLICPTHACRIFMCRIPYVLVSSTLYKVNVVYYINSEEVRDVNTIENI